ncbi:hypothetical protein [Agromyces sp. Marseille-P2726]|uniref:hypothetical protein n=1 Tax=Agromyces sp. Marseille-P2726 TaxID=2709132 RepID=UPI00156E5924|nr:hypothetical protein [Agromyces sp. Marseille-P2726]
MPRLALALRVILPAFWLGALIALSFIESPLKFQAPGITIPLGLGIGRLVFTALNFLGVVIAAVLTLVSIRPAAGRLSWWLLGGAWAVLLLEILVIRPPLNARTDLVIAGAEPGQSPFHYIYIAADVVLVAILIALTVVNARRVIPAVSLGAARVGADSRS